MARHTTCRHLRDIPHTVSDTSSVLGEAPQAAWANNIGQTLAPVVASNSLWLSATVLAATTNPSELQLTTDAIAVND